MSGQCAAPPPSTRKAVTPDGDGARDAEHTADANALVASWIARHDLADAERRVVEVERATQATAERKARKDTAGQRKGARGDMPRILAGARQSRAESTSGDQARLALLAQERAAQGLAPSVLCWGDAPTLADCCLVPQIFNGKRFNVNLDGLPLTMGAFEACMALPAFQQAQPSACPDFEA